MEVSVFLRFVPAPLIRFAGRMQFRFPFLRGFVNFVGQSMAGKGTIQRGFGKGLLFDSRGCNPGYLAGTSEPLEQELVAKYSRPGAVVYDLGANAGFYAIIAAHSVGPEGAVYAFEPTPTLAQRIRENARSNGFANLHVIEMAVSGSDGAIRFGVSGPTSVINSIRAAESTTSIEVGSVRLDTFCKTHPAPALLLIDIEGAELDALEGALGMIARHLPVIMVEVHWLGKGFIDFFERSLKPLGYVATTYEGKPLETGNTRYHALLLPPANFPKAR